MSKSLSIEYAKKNITVNCVSPGFIVSDMTRVSQKKLSLYFYQKFQWAKWVLGMMCLIV